MLLACLLSYPPQPRVPSASLPCVIVNSRKIDTQPVRVRGSVSLRGASIRPKKQTHLLGFIYIPPAHILAARLGSTTRHYSSLVVCFRAIDLISAIAPPSSCSSCSPHCLLIACCGQCHRSEHLPRLLYPTSKRYWRQGRPRNATLVTPRPRLGPHPCGETGRPAPAVCQKRHPPRAKAPLIAHDGRPFPSVSSLDADATRLVFRCLYACPFPSSAKV